MANLTSKNRLEKTCCKAGPLSRFVHWVYAMYDYVYIHVCIYIYADSSTGSALLHPVPDRICGSV